MKDEWKSRDCAEGTGAAQLAGEAPESGHSQKGHSQNGPVAVV